MKRMTIGVLSAVTLLGLGGAAQAQYGTPFAPYRPEVNPGPRWQFGAGYWEDVKPVRVESVQGTDIWFINRTTGDLTVWRLYDGARDFTCAPGYPCQGLEK